MRFGLFGADRWRPNSRPLAPGCRGAFCACALVLDELAHKLTPGEGGRRQSWPAPVQHSNSVRQHRHCEHATKRGHRIESAPEKCPPEAHREQAKASRPAAAAAATRAPRANSDLSGEDKRKSHCAIARTRLPANGRYASAHRLGTGRPVGARRQHRGQHSRPTATIVCDHQSRRPAASRRVATTRRLYELGASDAPERPAAAAAVAATAAAAAVGWRAIRRAASTIDQLEPAGRPIRPPATSGGARAAAKDQHLRKQERG